MSEEAVEATGLPHCLGLLSWVVQIDHLQGVDPGYWESLEDLSSLHAQVSLFLFYFCF